MSGLLTKEGIIVLIYPASASFQPKCQDFFSLAEVELSINQGPGLNLEDRDGGEGEAVIGP